MPSASWAIAGVIVWSRALPVGRPGRTQVVAKDVSLAGQVGGSAGGTWLASRAPTAAAASATARMDGGAASWEAASAQRAHPLIHESLYASVGRVERARLHA